MASERGEASTQNNNSPYGNALMIESRDDINPWTNKLREVKLPDINDSWEGMVTVLDREMPDSGRKGRRRWLLLVLLLLLLIGVCNCPVVSRFREWSPSGRLPGRGNELNNSVTSRNSP